MIRTRFAPSPTGDLHVGGAWTALASWFVARRHGASGRVLVRVEDLDPPREIAGAAARILEDLTWLGLDWDEGPFTQSERHAIYDAAIAELTAKGRVYPCDCSRSEIKQMAGVAQAPHAGEEIVYPGNCRPLPHDRVMKRPPALRFDVGDETIAFVDEIQGPVRQDLRREVGDFVLRRGDGLYAYQLAVVVDDLAMDVTHVVRGADLLTSTPRQIALARALGAKSDFTYLHVPLVTAADGSRLAKRTGGQTIRELRANGMSAEEILAPLRVGLGIDREPPAWRKEPFPSPF